MKKLADYWKSIEDNIVNHFADKPQDGLHDEDDREFMEFMRSQMRNSFYAGAMASYELQNSDGVDVGEELAAYQREMEAKVRRELAEIRRTLRRSHRN